MSESKILLALASKFASLISSLLSLGGAFPVSKPDGKNDANRIAEKMAITLNYYFKVDKDLAYQYIQQRMTEFDVKWVGELTSTDDDDPALQEKVIEIMNDCIDSLKVDPSEKLAMFRALKEIKLEIGLSLASGQTFFVKYVGDDQLKDYQKKFSGIATLEKW